MEMWSHPEQVMHWLLVLTFVSVIPATCRTIGHAAGFSIAQSLWWAHFIKFHRLLSALLFTLTVIFELGCVAASIIAALVAAVMLVWWIVNAIWTSPNAALKRVSVSKRQTKNSHAIIGVTRGHKPRKPTIS